MKLQHRVGLYIVNSNQLLLRRHVVWLHCNRLSNFLCGSQGGRWSGFSGMFSDLRPSQDTQDMGTLCSSTPGTSRTILAFITPPHSRDVTSHLRIGCGITEHHSTYYFCQLLSTIFQMPNWLFTSANEIYCFRNFQALLVEASPPSTITAKDLQVSSFSSNCYYTFFCSISSPVQHRTKRVSFGYWLSRRHFYI